MAETAFSVARRGAASGKSPGEPASILLSRYSMGSFASASASA